MSSNLAPTEALQTMIGRRGGVVHKHIFWCGTFRNLEMIENSYNIHIVVIYL